MNRTIYERLKEKQRTAKRTLLIEITQAQNTTEVMKAYSRYSGKLEGIIDAYQVYIEEGDLN